MVFITYEDLCLISTSTQARSSHQRCSLRRGILRNFAKFTGKHVCQSLFINNVAGLRLDTAKLLKNVCEGEIPSAIGETWLVCGLETSF